MASDLVVQTFVDNLGEKSAEELCDLIIEAHFTDAIEELKTKPSFQVTVNKRLRWYPYNEKSNEAKKGIKGRFQERDEDGKWRNTKMSDTQIVQAFKGVN